LEDIEPFEPVREHPAARVDATTSGAIDTFETNHPNRRVLIITISEKEESWFEMAD